MAEFDLGEIYDAIMKRAKDRGLLEAFDVGNKKEVEEFKKIFVKGEDTRDLTQITEPTIHFVFENGMPFYHDYYSHRSARPLLGIFVPNYENTKKKGKDKETHVKPFDKVQKHVWIDIYRRFPEDCKKVGFLS